MPSSWNQNLGSGFWHSWMSCSSFCASCRVNILCLNRFVSCRVRILHVSMSAPCRGHPECTLWWLSALSLHQMSLWKFNLLPRWPPAARPAYWPTSPNRWYGVQTFNFLANGKTAKQIVSSMARIFYSYSSGLCQHAGHDGVPFREFWDFLSPRFPESQISRHRRTSSQIPT